MKPFLEECGYGTDKLEHISGLFDQTVGISGAVISLALSSSITESADEVFLKLKRLAPRVPVLFAAMLSLEQARPALERIAKQAKLQVNITGIDPTPVAAAQLGRQETFLYVSKEDLTSPARRSTAERLIQRHFR
ncbi:MAG: hypothetical protein A2535_00550 [Burkholderiales bacterium RIFOXYD2_FULL_59_8]|nr:MAG: hypothetical protein A2503_14560 [Burkholderiales bacterium RIFOXYD12_FULL_59_19]OGB84680.1 MAG: hypothetical protein A2535_00550 [Burkholderiales bacterium RIFOXYD2_FULL_59_8]